jgi:hypothetical protein
MAENWAKSKGPFIPLNWVQRHAGHAGFMLVVFFRD